MSKGIVLGDGTPASDPNQRPVDPLRNACQLLADQCVKSVGGNLLSLFADRLAGGARLVTQVILHLPDGTFILAAGSLNKRAPGGVDGLSAAFSSTPVGPGTEKVAGMVAVERINANIKQAAAAGLDVVMSVLADAIPDRTLEGRLLVLNANVVDESTACTGIVVGRFGPFQLPADDTTDDHEPGPELPAERGE